MSLLRDVSDQAGLDHALERDRAILYKHSTRCPVSTWAIDEVRQFADDHPDWPVYVLKVIEHRDLSNQVATQFDVRHESPQIFILINGRTVWHASHSDITERALIRETA